MSRQGPLEMKIILIFTECEERDAGGPGRGQVLLRSLVFRELSATRSPPLPTCPLLAEEGGSPVTFLPQS